MREGFRLYDPEAGSAVDGRVKFAKMDVDQNPKIPSSFGIRGIPALLLFKEGTPVDQVVGDVPKAVLKERLDKIVS